MNDNESARKIASFYRKQVARYVAPGLFILALDIGLIYGCPSEAAWKSAAVASVSGALGSFIRFFFSDGAPRVSKPLEAPKLHDTEVMLRYWWSLMVGAILGFFSSLVLGNARLFRFFYPHIPAEVEPTIASVALFAGFTGLLAREVVAATKKNADRED